MPQDNSVTKKQSEKFSLSAVTILSLGHFSHDVYSSFLAPILPILIEKFGLSYAMSSFLYLIRRIPSLANPIIGILADKTSVRYFIILAPVLTASAMSFLTIAPSYIVICILLFVAGISSACFHVPTPVMIKHVSGKRIGMGMSFYMLGGELSRSVGPLVILGAISLWGVEETYKLIPLGVVASGILFFKLKNIEKNKHIHIKKGGSHLIETLVELKTFFLILGGYSFFKAMIATTLTSFLPVYMKNKGCSLWVAGTSLSILEIAGAVGVFVAGSVSDKLGRKNIILISAIFSPILMWLFVISEGFIVAPILLFLGFFILSPTPVVMALVQEHGFKHPASVNGVYMTISFLISSIVIMIIGFLSDKIGLENTYRLTIFISLGSIPFALMLPTQKPKDNME